MTLEIDVLSWDRHTHVAVNVLMWVLMMPYAKKIKLITKVEQIRYRDSLSNFAINLRYISGSYDTVIVKIKIWRRKLIK